MDYLYAIGDRVLDSEGVEVSIRDLYFKGDDLMAELEYADGSRRLSITMDQIQCIPATD